MMAGAERLGVGGARFRRWRPAESAAEARACRSRRDAPRGTPASISSSGLLVRHGLSEVSGRVVSARAGTTVAGVQLPVDQAAFMDIITVDSVAEAPAVFAKWGVVRVRNLLSQEEVTTLLNAAKDYGVRRDAFAQDSQSDRYTLWIAGDGMSEEQLAATKSIKENVPCIEKAIFHEDDSSWRPVCDAFGYPNLMLAEVVTSTPGGAPQDWHFDGEGITAQVSLVQIDASNGPTEIQPRPVPKAYMQWMKHLSNEAPGKSKDDMAAVLAELTTEIKMMYDRLSKAHEFAWNTLRPILGNNVAVARSIIEAGLTPPVVHMVADVGTLTLYDAAMIHRGGGSAPSRLVSLSLSSSPLVSLLRASSRRQPLAPTLTRLVFIFISTRFRLALLRGLRIFLTHSGTRRSFVFRPEPRERGAAHSCRPHQQGEQGREAPHQRQGEGPGHGKGDAGQGAGGEEAPGHEATGHGCRSSRVFLWREGWCAKAGEGDTGEGQGIGQGNEEEGQGEEEGRIRRQIEPFFFAFCLDHTFPLP